MLLNTIKGVARKSLAFGTVSVLALGMFSQSSFAQNRLIGYIPSYANMPAVADRTDLSKLTHINLSFLNPNASGAVANGTNPVCMLNSSGVANIPGSDITYVVNKAHAAGVKVLVSMAGGGIPGCSGNWATLLQPGNRTNLVNNIVNYLNTMNLDGVDIDIEGELLTSIDNAGNYTPFIQALRNALPGKLLTSATASYNGGMVPISSLQYFDFVNIMSYDAVGPGWGTAGAEHSSYAMADSDITLWLNRGLPKSKIVLGVPFYGYGFGGMPSSITFNNIVNQYGAAAAQNDIIGTRCVGCAYITYNGIPTIRNKTQLAMNRASGVMIWELSQDGTGANSLLSVIRNQMGTVTPTGVVNLYQHCSFGGYTAALGEGSYTLAQLNALGIRNDDISSLKVQAGYQIKMYNDANFSGSTITKTADDSCLVDDGYNDLISSVVVSKVSTGGWSLQVEAENFANQSGVQTEGCSEGGSNVGWIDTADWMTYTNVNIPTSGTYRIDYRIASVSGGTLAANLNTNAVQFPAVAVTATGGWQNWQTVSQTVTINAGTYNFGVYASTGGWNINWIKFTKL
ncbi:MAG: carbohydrate-binding protein [Sphingobacteriales bacterium]|nr:MAG: carbohydrate-binding protein [Sphingobacteriales bacterium]